MTALTTRPALRTPEILDEFGRPLAITRRLVAAPNPRGQQTYNSHPAIGLTTEILLSYYRSAENGSPVRQMDTFDDLRERDGELRGMINDRIEDVAGWDFEIIPPPGRTDRQSVVAAGELNARLQSKIEFREFIAHQLGSVYDGYACTNLVWDFEENVVAPVKFANIAPRRFGAPNAERADEILLIDAKESAFGLIPLEAGLWAVSRYRFRNPYAAGLMRTCSWWSMFKLVGFKQFQVWLDMYGLPLAIGYYEEGASEPSRLALEEAVKRIGQDGYAILSALTEVVIKDAPRGESSAHQHLIRICDAINTKLITGGTLNTDVAAGGAGSYNAAAIHKSRLDAMKRHDARVIEEMFVRDIGTTFIAWNGFDRAAPPRLKIKIPWGDLERAKTLEIIGSAVPLSKAQIREEFNLRTPNDKSDEVKFEPTPLEDPGRQRPERTTK